MTGIAYLDILMEFLTLILKKEIKSHAVPATRSGKPRHNNVAVLIFLDQTFPRKLIGSRGRVTCPFHLPDLH
jgi:hypothetical protein